jgi:type I restriction-modification system DNA methylase subunit
MNNEYNNNLSYEKKLNLNSINNSYDILKNTMIEQSHSVSNKEALKDKIHEIHNYLRNNGAGYGMNALKVFNIIYGLKKIEENNLLDRVSLRKPDCEFSYLLQLANENKGEELAALIFGNVLQSICESELRDLLFYEIPQNIRGSVFVYLIKEINKITIIEKTCNVLLSGKIYEYFIGRDESAISELGAYFTDRHIVDYILEKLNPTVNEDGAISSMIDMFGGSGGFTTGYINYLNNKYPQLINWETEINKISHFDMNEDVIKSAGLEFFCLTGVLPNMNNLKYKNSFTDEFAGDDNRPLKYKYPLTNPPYGGDKNSKSEAQMKREKVKEYIKNELTTITDEELRIRRQKQLKTIEDQEKQDKKEQDKTKVSVSSCSGRIQKFAKDNNLKGNDKESCSLMLLMDILEVGGTAIGVLKEGVFFNKTYKDLRKCLVENFNVREVISVPQDQFENTSTKTSIVIFDNTEQKTTEVKFSDLVIERYTEDKFAEIFGDIVIIENKGDIKDVSDTLISQATKEEIIGNAICSLNGKDYNKKEIVVGEGYELVKLGSICEFYKYKSQEPNENGIHNYYTCSNTIQKCINGNIKGEYVIMGTRGTITDALHYNNGEFGCGNNMLLFNSNIYNNKYIYYILLSQKNNIKNAITGSTIPMISMNKFKDVIISITKSPSKIQEWVDKISAPYNEKNTKQTQIKELELFVQNRIKEIGENEECDEVELGSVCEIKYGKRITEKKNKGTKYDAYGGGNIMSYKTDEYNRSGVTYKISRDGLSLHNCISKIYGKIFLNDTALTLHTKTDRITDEYIGEVLLSKREYIYKNCSHGSAQLHIDIDRLMNIKIKIPKNKQIIQDLEETFRQIETLQNEVKNADELYKQLIQELSQEAIPQSQEIITQPVLENNIEEIVENPKKVKKSIKKVKLIVEE